MQTVPATWREVRQFLGNFSADKQRAHGVHSGLLEGDPGVLGDQRTVPDLSSHLAPSLAHKRT